VAAVPDRRRRILDVAGQLFHERGFHGVGMDEIGKRAGVTGPAVYRHFAGKDEILATLFDEAMDLVIVNTDGRFDDPRKELEFLVRHHADFVVEQRAIVSVYAHEHRFLVDPWRRLFNRRMREHAARWERTIAACYPGAPEDAVAVASQGAIGLLNSVVFWPPPALGADDLTDWLCRLVIEGLDTLSATRKPSATRPKRARVTGAESPAA
jgi:AcrR family transcriptional regulator